MKDIAPTLSMINGVPVVSSQDIAEHFSKHHKDVLRKIEGLEIPEDFRRRNFTPSSYINSQNKEQPVFHLTRDGFTLLVMGFTGKKATQWKIRYIEAFNRMEQTLICKLQQAALPAGTCKVNEPTRLSEDFSRFASDSDAFDMEMLAYYKNLRARLRLNMRKGQIPRLLERQLSALDKAHNLTTTAMENFSVAAEQAERLIDLKQQLK